MGWTSFTDTGRSVAEDIVKAIELRGIPARIDRIYWDAGAGIKIDTIVTESQLENTKGMEFQLLDPADIEKMNDGTITAEEVIEIISRVF
ncbi:hypothetical protein 010DV004_51 [Bacillus phage 010DV004]|nr:hypothetical protein 010DV004_51 [Bacillus phage 010DV004]QZA69268.1 hypothetical protein 010DV005_51 [Bacillus phage 010DV005]